MLNLRVCDTLLKIAIPVKGGEIFLQITVGQD